MKPMLRSQAFRVRFNGNLLQAFRACLWSRIAIRVLVPLGKGSAENERAYYDAAHALPIEDFVVGLGFLDDAAVLAWVVSSVRSVVSDFEKWESTRPG